MERRNMSVEKTASDVQPRSPRIARAVNAFKLASWNADAHAWCAADGCAWELSHDATERDRRGVRRVIEAARTHTAATGHETRIDITHQRGYRIGPPPGPAEGA